MKTLFFLIIALILSVSACSKKNDSVKIKITNPTDLDLKGMTIQVSELSVLEKIFRLGENVSIVSEGKNLPFQLIKKNEKLAEVLVLCDLKPGEEKKLEITRSDRPTDFKHRTQAEISIKEGGKWVWVTKSNGTQQFEYQGGTWKNVSEINVPKQHTDHSFDIRYEGPGWESDKVGYRFYLDWRNAVDLFGKKVDTLVLQNVGLDGFDSYHIMSDWGADILKVDKSLGIGTIGFWANDKANRVEKTDSLYSRIDYSGVLESKITTIYSGWETAEGKTNLTSELSIRAGSYLSKYDIELTNPLENLCTGIIKLDKTVVLTSGENRGKWGYLATFGVQSLEKDRLGLAIFYKKNDLIKVAGDKLNHVVVLKPANKKLTYYFGAAWEQDNLKIKTEQEFVEFLNSQLQLLNQGML